MNDKLETIKNSGREIAEGWMRSGFINSKDAVQLDNHMILLRSAAISVLAHEAYNLNLQRGISLNDYLVQLLKEIRNETLMLEETPEAEFEIASKKRIRK